jgi:transcription elongation factor Elf1
VVSIPAEERVPCPVCGTPAVVIDRTVASVTTCCLECGRTVRKPIN